ncbi:MAG: S8/S53 family peptidase [Pseudomonadota bacterium]
MSDTDNQPEEAPRGTAFSQNDPHHPSLGRDAGAGDLTGLGLHYLWHLIDINLLNLVEIPSNADAAAQQKLRGPDGWGKLHPGDDRKRVAIIDNGACAHHPNLPGHAIKNRADFAYFERGATFSNWQGWPASGRDVGSVKDWLADNLTNEEAAQTRQSATALVDELIGAWSTPVPAAANRASPQSTDAGPLHRYHDLEDPSRRFAAHGTACAGLVADRPPEDVSAPPSGAGGCPTEQANPWAIQYVGVNPEAEIMPINTAYSHEYKTVTNALLWAYWNDAAVILLPRGLPDLEPIEPHEGIEDQDPRRTRFTTKGEPEYERLNADRRVFEAVLAAISAEIPVVVASGNNGRRELEYPACLVNRHGKDITGPIAPDLIVAGAQTHRGVRSSYSSGRTNNGVTVYAPSDDAEEISKAYSRFERRGWRGRQLRLAPEEGNDYSPYGVLAIDIPGPYGYENMYEQDLEHFDEGQPGHLAPGQSGLENSPGSLYTVFGGTSAAASIVAGVISLLQCAATSRLRGKDAKDLLILTRKPQPDAQEDVLVVDVRGALEALDQAL